MISVIVGTFGADSWRDLAEQRAVKSVMEQSLSPVSVHQIHADTLHEARNQGAAEATGEWLCFLDADDELDTHYLRAMTDVIRDEDMLIQPATVYLTGGEPDSAPFLIPRFNSILDSNWMVIGTLVRKATFMSVGGFQGWPIYEDWDLWIRCLRQGSILETAPAAIYKVHQGQSTRNNQDGAIQSHYYHAIRNQYI